MRRWIQAGVVVVLLGAGAVGLTGCKTHSEAVADPCAEVSNKGAPQDPKVGLTPEEVKAQNKCSSATRANDQVCVDVQQLKSSVSDLKNVDVVKNGADDLRAALDKVEQNAQALRTDSGAALRPAVDQLSTALSALESAIRNVVSQGTAQVKTAAQDAADAARNLENQAQGLKCDEA
jgi:uncharacterized phage infection (PIP) family protein YhgE